MVTVIRDSEVVFTSWGDSWLKWQLELKIIAWSFPLTQEDILRVPYSVHIEARLMVLVTVPYIIVFQSILSKAEFLNLCETAAR